MNAEKLLRTISCSMAFTKAVRGDSTSWAAKMLAIRFRHLKEDNPKLACEFLKEIQASVH